MTEQFRAVYPLIKDEDFPVASISRTDKIELSRVNLTVPEARALRDWLNRALPEETLTGDTK